MRIIKTVSIGMMCLLLLSGCTGRELEDREFVEAMELNMQEEELVGGFGGALVSGSTVEEIRKSYQNHMDVYLDLGHIKAIVLGKELLKNKEKMRSVLLELEQMPMISRNSLVFTHNYDSGESYLVTLARQGKIPGEYLCDTYHNNPYHTEDEVVSLGDLLSTI